MMCIRGEAEQLPFLTEIAELGAGVELGSYGLLGIQSEQDWETRVTMHRRSVNNFKAQLQSMVLSLGWNMLTVTTPFEMLFVADWCRSWLYRYR